MRLHRAPEALCEDVMAPTEELWEDVLVLAEAPRE